MRNPNHGRVPRPGAVLHLYRDVWALMHGQRRVFAGAVLLLVGAQSVLLAVPYLSGRALNALQLHGREGLHESGLWMAAVLLVAAGSWLLHGPGRILERSSALTVRRRMSGRLIERLFALPLAWHELHHSGATAHRIQQSTGALCGFTQSQFIYLNSAVRLVGPLLALACLQPLIGVAALAGFALIMLSVVGFDRAMLRLANEENDAERRYAATLVDTLGNTASIYALRQSRGLAERIERRLTEIFAPLRRSIVLNEAKWCTVDLSSRALTCALVAIFAWCTTRPAAGSSHGTVVLLGSVYMVWEYAQQAGGVISSFASHFQTFARQHADYSSAAIIEEGHPAHRSGLAPRLPRLSQWQRLWVRDLTFRHPHSHTARATLEGIHLTLERGKRYALIGSSGSGKSSLLRVLAGLYPAERLAIAFDGGPGIVHPHEAAEALRASATLIPQDAEMYEGTLAENLALCESVSGPPSRADFAHALEVSCASGFVAADETGLQTCIVERAANWSGGQRSRVALARGVLAAAGSALVLLDEPTASLDGATQAQVYANLFASFADACLVSSVHRLDLLGAFDEVLVMSEGRVVAQGNPDDLALSCAEFRRLNMVHQREDASGVAPRPASAAA